MCDQRKAWEVRTGLSLIMTVADRGVSHHPLERSAG